MVIVCMRASVRVCVCLACNSGQNKRLARRTAEHEANILRDKYVCFFFSLVSVLPLPVGIDDRFKSFTQQALAD